MRALILALGLITLSACSSVIPVAERIVEDVEMGEADRVAAAKK